MSQTAAVNPQVLILRIRTLIDAGRLGAARPLLSALTRVTGPSADVAELEARLKLREGHFHEALATLDQAFATYGPSPRLHICRAQARVEVGDLWGAASDASEAVILDSSEPNPKALLGMILVEMQRYGEAVECLEEALRDLPDQHGWLISLAKALEKSGREPEALAVLSGAAERLPGRADIRVALLLLHIRRRDFQTAIDLGEAARRDGVADACVFGLIGHAHSAMGRHTLAIPYYQDALKLAPEDEYIRHLLAAAGALPSAERAPEAYLRVLFNGYSNRFEQHLISLQYRIPGLFREILSRVQVAPGPVLELGCGTGLTGLTCGDLGFEAFVGVDVSPGMLEQARAKGIYAELHEADIIAFLQDETRGFPLVMAADVLCYFGRLEEVMTWVAARLDEGGLFLFSVEALLPDFNGKIAGEGDVALGAAGRYAHGESYLRNCLAKAGLDLASFDREVLRFDNDAPVQGFVCVARKHAAPHA